MTKKDFELIAQIIDGHAFGSALNDNARATLAKRFAGQLAATNPRFDRARFLAACGVTA